MRDWIDLDSLHVISDLHLGGREGFQIFGSTAELCWLIGHVAGLEAGRHALLINGDFVDFLAEEPCLAFDPHGAIDKLDGIWKRFGLVFKALQRLLATPDRLLIINLGNHDLELGLPWVRAHLTKKLTEGDEVARARLIWITDGTGVRCRVGNARIVGIHGNEVDSWNVADYERLRRIGRDMQLGLNVEAWQPNAGAQLVIEVMNEVKRHYPFVDLLKPEKVGVLPILAALNPGVHRKLTQLAGIARHRAWDIARMRTGFLDSEAQATAEDAQRLPPVLPISSAGRGSESLLADVEAAWRQGVEPMSLVRGVQSEQLGIWSAAGNLVSRKPKHEMLREALEYLDRDRSFDPSASDETFRDIDAMVGPDVEIVVAGHTHLERSLERTRGRGHYFNSGTWARLVRIEPEVRQNADAFETLYRLFAGAGMDALDAAKVNAAGKSRDVVIRRNSVVMIGRDAAGAPVRASLQHVRQPDPSGPFELVSAGGKTWVGG
jgi:UDP-2,3-diacylglucosamine pyrophosphatase LpxH